MPTTHQRKTEGQGKPQVRRAIIYLREPVQDETNRTGIVPSIEQQRVRCRHMATSLYAEIIGEMIDLRAFSPYGPGLKKVLATARRSQRVDYLILSSWDRLAATTDGALELVWHLAFVGTAVVSADAEYDFRWTG